MIALFLFLQVVQREPPMPVMPEELRSLAVRVADPHCEGGCEREVIVANASFGGTIGEQRAAAKGDDPGGVRGDVDEACLVNPLTTDFTVTATGRVLSGILVHVMIRPLAVDAKSTADPVRLPVLMTIGRQPSGAFSRTTTDPAAMATRSPIRLGRWCGDRSLDRRLRGQSWTIADPAQIAIRDVPSLSFGLSALMGPMPYVTMKLRRGVQAAKQGVQQMLSAMPSSAAMKPGNWLMDWETGTTRQLAFRSTPKGASILLDSVDLGITTDRIVSMSRDVFERIGLRLNGRDVSTASCVRSRSQSRDVDEVIDCSFNRRRP